jgi:hypothetical protein
MTSTLLLDKNRFVLNKNSFVDLIYGHYRVGEDSVQARRLGGRLSGPVP